MSVESCKYNKLHTQYIIVIACFSISVFLGIGVHFIAVLPSYLYYLLVPSSILFGFAGIYIYSIIEFSKIRDNKVFFIWLLFSIYMIVIGIISSNGSWKTPTSISWLILQDLRYVMYIAIGFAFANKRIHRSFYKLMKILGVISIFFGIIALLVYQFSAEAIDKRIGGWDWPYYLWWLSASIFAYHFSFSRITGRDKIIGYGTFAIYIILGMLFLKRSVIVNAVFLLIITYILKPNKSNIKTRLISLISRCLIVLCIVLLIILVFQNEILRLVGNTYFGKVLIATIERFNVDSLTTYDRAIESNLYFKSVNFISIILGNGLGNYLIVNGLLMNAIHIGLFNIIYKGGILFILLWIYLIVNIIKSFLAHKNLSEYKLVCLCVSLSAALSLLYEFSFTYTLVPFGYATSIAYLLQKEEDVYEDMFLRSTSL